MLKVYDRMEVGGGMEVDEIIRLCQKSREETWLGGAMDRNESKLIRNRRK